MRILLPAFCLVSLFVALPSASAHYLWITIAGKPGQHGSANIYFEEGPAAGDGHYMDHFTGSSKTWFRTVEQIEPKLIKTADTKEGDKRWLRAELPSSGPRSVDCYGKFGVYRYGETDVLLHYYARSLDVSTHEDLHELSRAEHMDLDIVPHDEGAEVELKVLWLGKPVKGQTLFIRGPRRFRKNIKTSDRGTVRFKPADKGRYTFRVHVELPKAGREGDKPYSAIRHHGTLIMKLPLTR